MCFAEPNFDRPSGAESRRKGLGRNSQSRGCGGQAALDDAGRYCGPRAVPFALIGFDRLHQPCGACLPRPFRERRQRRLAQLCAVRRVNEERVRLRFSFLPVSCLQAAKRLPRAWASCSRARNWPRRTRLCCSKSSRCSSWSMRTRSRSRRIRRLVRWLCGLSLCCCLLLIVRVCSGCFRHARLGSHRCVAFTARSARCRGAHSSLCAQRAIPLDRSLNPRCTLACWFVHFRRRTLLLSLGCRAGLQYGRGGLGACSCAFVLLLCLPHRWPSRVRVCAYAGRRREEGGHAVRAGRRSGPPSFGPPMSCSGSRCSLACAVCVTATAEVNCRDRRGVIVQHFC